MAWDPFTLPEIVGRELGERPCLHVRPGRLTMLECRFNKTTHHPKSGLVSAVDLITLGVGGIVCDIVDEGVSQVVFTRLNLAQGNCHRD